MAHTPYPLLDDDEDDENITPEPKNIKEEYEENTKVVDDEKDFVCYMLKLSKIEREASILSGEFHDCEVTPYEAKVKLLALLDISVQLRDDLMKTM